MSLLSPEMQGWVYAGALVFPLTVVTMCDLLVEWMLKRWKAWLAR